MTDLLRLPEDLLLTDVEVDGQCLDVRVDAGLVSAIGPHLQGGTVVRGEGGALLPGLHDHHLHLFAMAAQAGSVACGPPEVIDLAGLRHALATAPGTGWVRGIGYYEGVAGTLDRALLDALVPGRPARVQHRTGGQWTLNSLAMQQLDVTDVPDGLVWRDDPRLRNRSAWPDLTRVGRMLADCGVLGVTDATPDLEPETLQRIADAGLPQQVLALGAPAGWSSETVTPGPLKLLLGDEKDLDFGALLARISTAHAQARPVAVHTVTRASLVVALAVLEEVGPMAGDRLEHAAVLPDDLLPIVARLGVAVVTQPALAAARGDDYLREVAPEDRDCLWPYGSLLSAGIQAAPSSDSPYGPADPWEVLRQARDRRTPEGQVLGARERVSVRAALDGFLSPAHDPGGRPRRVEVGCPADLVLLRVPLADALDAPSADLVRLVVAAR